MKLSMSYRLAAIAIGLATAIGFVAGCSSDDSSNNPIIPVDAGPQPDSTVPTTDSSTPGQDSSTPVTDSGSLPDTNLPDVGNCVSDAATCNSCYTITQDPRNACSPYSVSCIPFDNSKIPSGAP
jgi:hypothetical protein